jgi:hypothetical protein
MKHLLVTINSKVASSPEKIGLTTTSLIIGRCVGYLCKAVS